MNLRTCNAIIRAYNWMELTDTKEQQAWLEKAEAYLKKDRERFLMVTDPNMPVRILTATDGIICKLLPLAVEETREEMPGFIRQKREVYSLLLEGNKPRYVRANYVNRLFEDPEKNEYGYPTYRYITFGEISRTAQLLPPEQIMPVSTPLKWDCFCMILFAYNQFTRDYPAEIVPYKTERAMLALEYAKTERLSVSGKPVTGKVVPIAQSETPRETTGEDHRCSTVNTLCLLVGEQDPRYVMKIRRQYRYFSKRPDGTGGYIYEEAGEKQEISYRFVELHMVQENMMPYYQG